MDFIRARSDGQKNIRLKQITDAAVELFDTEEYDKITLAAISKRLEFSRANLYKYVSSKEEIYLTVTIYELNGFIQDLLHTFEAISNAGIEEFSRIWSETLYRHERLLKLFSILFSMIEKNVPVGCLAEFKRQLFAAIECLRPLLKRLLPVLPEESILIFLEYQLHYIAGLYPSTVLNEIQREAIRLSGIPFEAKDFVSVFSGFLTTMLAGLCRLDGQNPAKGDAEAAM